MNHPTELELAILALLSCREAPFTAAGLIASLRKHNAFEPEALENIGVVLDSLWSSGQVECTTGDDATSTYRLTAVGRDRLRARLAQETER